MTAIQTVLLLFGGMSLFDALCTSFGTVASGGFSPRNASIAYYDSSYIDWVVILFMVVAGTNFALHYRFVTGNFRSYGKDREFHFFIGSLVVASLLVLAGAWNVYDDKLVAVRDSIFVVTSLHTSTGFGLADYELWSNGAQFVLLRDHDHRRLGRLHVGRSQGRARLSRLQVYRQRIHARAAPAGRRAGAHPRRRRAARHHDQRARLLRRLPDRHRLWHAFWSPPPASTG